MPVERLTANSKLLAKVGNNRASLAHGGLSEPHLRRRHLRFASAIATTRASRGEARDRALADQLALELGERGEDTKHQFAGGGCRVDCRALPSQHAQPDGACIEVMHDVHEMPEVAPEAIEFPDYKCVTGTQRFEAGVEAGAVVLLAARGVAVDVALGHTGGDQRVLLQVEDLGAVGL